MGNKKAGEKKMLGRKGNLGNMTMVFLFLFLVIIIGLALYVGAELFFASGYDAREVDANLLGFKIESCASEYGEGIFKDAGSFFEKCKLNRNITEDYNIIRVCKGSEDCMNEANSAFILFESGSNFVACGLEGGKANYNYPKCVLRDFMIGENKYKLVVGGKQVIRKELTA